MKNKKKTIRFKKTEIRKTNKNTLSTLNSKLDKIFELQKNILEETRKIEKTDQKVYEEEKKTENEELSILENLHNINKNIDNTKNIENYELLKLKELEEEVKKDVGEHPLKKFGSKDILKGIVGAFIGLVVHYTFFYGIKISENIDFIRATFLFILAFFVGMLFLYTTGFRKIKDPKILVFIPLRLLVLYIISIIMSIFVLYLFYPKFGHDLIDSYKMISVVLLAAIIGACTADLIGKE